MRNADKDKRQQRGVSGWKPVRTFDGFVPCTPCRALASNNARRAIDECRAGNARRLPLIHFCNRSWNSRCYALRITYEGSVITKDNAENRSQKRPERDPYQTDQKLDGLGIAKRKSGKISEISLTKEIGKFEQRRCSTLAMRSLLRLSASNEFRGPP
jgi:hypothetical protein